MTLLAVQGSPRSQSSDGDDPVFLLHINQPVDPAFVTIAYYVKGQKSGDGFAILGSSGPSLKMTATEDIPINLTLPHKDARVAALKVVVFCRDYGFAFVNIPSLADVASKRVDVDLSPLASVGLTGRVTLPKDEKPADLRVDIHYENHDFLFRYLEQNGGLIGGGIKVATTALAADGSFTTTIPDFAKDPLASRIPGRFHFNIRALRPCHGASEQSTAALIDGKPDIGPFSGIPMAASYPAFIALELRWPWASDTTCFAPPAR
jgi:hypothetical protein